MNTIDKFVPQHPLNTAVLFLVFSRLDTTKQVFEAIRQAKPPRLYIAADGARENKEGEAEKVQAVRNFILQAIDWPCEVKTLFRDSNLGCKYAVSGAISWFFENEEKGIILEDDCLPSQSFFWYCESLLERYKEDLRVGQISGFNRLGKLDLKYDIFFSRYPMIWGWATWRNRWEKYSPDLELLDEVIHNNLFEIYFEKFEAKVRLDNAKAAASGKINTWDYQWAFTMYINDFLSVIPAVNLIVNLGFGKNATHTSSINPYENLKLFNVERIDNFPEYMMRVKGYEDSISANKTYLKRLFEYVLCNLSRQFKL